MGASLAGVGVAGGLTVAGWFAIGPDHLAYAVVVQGGFLFLGLLATPRWADVGRSRYRVARLEPAVYRWLGVWLFNRILTTIGWNRAVRAMRDDLDAGDRKRRTLRGTELSETGHVLAGAATVLLAVVAVLSSHVHGALQILLVGVVVHGYPIMLQRTVRASLVG